MTVDRSEMDELVERHMAAEAVGDIDRAIGVYADDVEHDVVGWPTGPTNGRQGARAFYEYLGANFRGTAAEATRQWHADDALVIEHAMVGVVTGTLLGLPGLDREISFRMLHVFEFEDGKIHRENIWLDTAAIQAQLA
jgi:steroid delta-isomerase-like uncharacterized protein